MKDYERSLGTQSSIEETISLPKGYAVQGHKKQVSMNKDQVQKLVSLPTTEQSRSQIKKKMVSLNKSMNDPSHLGSVRQYLVGPGESSSLATLQEGYSGHHDG
mmetsp:Transcript_22916/g.35255  ORF Transcript_22916/g.35255 Transcript_22916/m.35255 type:complete len:103 (-) Transcript_22916:777-1085(-)